MRNIDSTLQAGLSAPVIEPVLFVMLAFKSGIYHLCSAGFDVTWNGQVYSGMGTFGSISSTTEGTEIAAEGISLTLSGIDYAILSECENDIQPLLPAKCWIGLMNQGQLIGEPYLFFGGVVDSPVINTTRDTATITLKLESRMALLNRASQRRYTSADQHANGYPDDTGFQFVEKMNDMAMRFGQ